MSFTDLSKLWFVCIPSQSRAVIWSRDDMPAAPAGDMPSPVDDMPKPAEDRDIFDGDMGTLVADILCDMIRSF